jgi:ATP-dependent DNA helicase RecQ
MTAPDVLAQAREVLRSRFGYASFRPGQERAVSSVLAGRDTLVVLPTGGGKSLCFQIPALLLPGLTVVVSPLISLMKDQVDALTGRGLPAAFINSTLTAAEVTDRLGRAQRGELKLLYVAPERFDTGTAAERLRTYGVSLLAVDEAHCISEWGHDFRPSYLRVGRVREALGSPPTVALTATATPEVRRDIVRQLRLTSPTMVITGFDRGNLRYHVVRTRTEADKDEALVEILGARPGQAIAYASTRRAVDRMTGVLGAAGVPAVAYHAGLDDDHRHGVQEQFMGEAVRVIVATNAFGMGIDKANVRTVVHHAMPGSLEAYYQEAGRAGRDGDPSDCVLLHAFQDRFTHEFFIRGSYPDRPVIERVYEALRHNADGTGHVSSSAREVAAMMRGDTKEREVESSIRILGYAGVLKNEPSTSSRIFIRLLASTERLKGALAVEDAVDRDLLRALWRSVGDQLYAGVLVDPAGLPPGFGGVPGVAAALDRLQERQLVAWERTGGGVRLADPGAPLDRFEVGWEGIERRRATEAAKLDTMQRYAYTAGCRRAFILRYFGDGAAGARCTGCDNCLGTHVEPPRVGNGQRRDRVAGPPSVGPGEERRTRRSGRSSAAVPTPAGAAGDLSAADARLLAALKALRTAIAREEQVPAYVVFPDRSLVEMAVRRPRSVSALEQVRGVGPAKLQKYGQRFLAVIHRDPAMPAT